MPRATQHIAAAAALLTATLAAADSVRMATSATPLAATSTHLLAADLTGDGRDEIIVFYASPNRYQVFSHDLTAGPTPGSPVTLLGSAISAVKKADLNADGLVDFVVVASDINQIMVLLNNGDGTLSPSPDSPIPSSDSLNALTIADHNRDGIPDILIAGHRTFLVYPGTGGGRFAYPSKYATETTAAISSMVYADIRAPGQPTLALLTPSAVQFYHPQGNRYVLAQSFPVSAGVDLHVTPTTTGGTPSLVMPITARPGAYVIRYEPSTNVYYGNLFPETSPAGISSHAAITPLGHSPLKIAFARTSGQAIVLTNNTAFTGSFELIDDPVLALDQGRRVTFANLRGNGHYDLVYTAGNPESLITIVSDENGNSAHNGTVQSFSDTPSRITPDPTSPHTPCRFWINGNTNPRRTAVDYEQDRFFIGSQPVTGLADPTVVDRAFADINGDGLLDSITHGSRGASSYHLAWQFQNPDGSFQPQMSTFITSTATRNLEIADFNNDGWPDAALLGTDNRVRILLGNGNGFTPHAAFIISNTTTTRSLIAADFDGDGNIDLACSNGSAGGSAAQIIYGRGDGSFELPVSHPIAQSMGASLGKSYARTADINRDGLPDLIFFGATTSVLLSAGHRQYLPFESLPGGQNPVAVNVADFDNDGFPDIASTYWGFTTIFYRTMEGYLRNTERIIHASNMQDMTVADVNHDGLPDLIYTATGSLGIITNQSSEFCVQDYKPDGQIDFFDVTTFLSDFNTQHPFADLNGDGVFNFFDLVAYLRIFANGC